jgi:hypothetical protein
MTAEQAGEPELKEEECQPRAPSRFIQSTPKAVPKNHRGRELPFPALRWAEAANARSTKMPPGKTARSIMGS